MGSAERYYLTLFFIEAQVQSMFAGQQQVLAASNKFPLNNRNG